MEPFAFQLPSRIVYGSGGFKEAGALAAELGKKALIVTHGSARGKLLADRLTAILSDAGVESAVFSGVVPNPTTESVNAGAEAAKSFGADMIVGLGGGSALDSAKAVAIGATHPGEAWDYRLWQKPIDSAKVPPIFAITTTSGTGAEITAVSVVTRTDEHCKFALVDKSLHPRIALVDPELTLSVPAHVTAATGFDAYCHAFECTINKARNDYVDAQALFAMRLVVDNLEKAIASPDDLPAREALALANTVAGVCIANVGVTLPHGIGMAIGGSAPRVAHGEALAIIYPEIARITWREAIPQYAAAARQMNPELVGVPDAEAAERAADGFSRFLNRIDLRIGLADKGVARETLAVIAKDAFGLPDYGSHPVVLDEPAVLELLNACYAVSG
ncbi:MAG: iron-containing alcohol dehydrogenase [Planctomycetota bacterium]|jgi:alcohol dehydrogenase class IV|nr:iron-containing alcohol dehydrogenase [Planctomycetota bacterium]